MTKDLALQTLGFLLLPFALAACGSTDLVLGSPSDGGVDSPSDALAADGAPGDSHDAGGLDSAGLDAGSDASTPLDASTCDPPTPGGWGITMDGLSASGCTKAQDCTPVYIGDDACEVHVVGNAQNNPCPNAAILTASYGTYSSRYQAINQACRAVCGPGSTLCSTPRVYCDMQGVAGPTCAICNSVDGGPCGP